MNHELNNLIQALWQDFSQPDFWWQFAVLLACLTLAKLAERVVRGHAPGESRALQVGHGGLKRLTFPVLALVLVAVARWLLKPWHPASLLSVAVPLLASMAVIRAVFFVLRVTFKPAGWLASFERLFALLVWGIVALHIVGLLPEVIDLLESVSFPVGKQKLNLWMVAQGIATVILSLLVALWLGGLVDGRLARADGIDRNLRVVFSRLAKALLVMLAVMVSLPLVGIDLTTLSVFGGALGVGLGFGLQKIASNYVSGFIILLDRSIRIGNVIAVGNERGEVTRITTRYTVLRGNTGIETIVPNEVLVGSIVLNESLSDRKVRIPLPVQVAYNTDLEQAGALMKAAARQQPRVLADPPPAVLLTAFGDSGINLELGVWIEDSEKGTQQLRSDINYAIWAGFRDAGIEIPYPQREVRMLGSSGA